ncbi:hypothetical protein CMI37_36145 [Candidatus Pacearchaeota archaeon]|nr:hypothetical protein [Candidatus Pacearchaeota archaeon]
MALYLPRGGDYERALRYVSQANGIAGAMEGASQGLALVMNMQKIADSALNMEIKQEEYAENRANAAADAYAKMDALQGGLSDVVGPGEGGTVSKGSTRTRAGAGAGTGRDGVSVTEAEDIAAALNTIAEYEKAVAADRTPPHRAGQAAAGGLGFSAEEELLATEDEDAPLSDLVQALGEGEELDPFVPQERDERAGAGAEVRAALEAMGLEPGSERAEALSPMITAKGPVADEALAAAMQELGLDAGPGIAATGADIQKPFDVTPRPIRPEGLMGEGLINPAVAFGFDGRTVLDPVAQMRLAELHNRGSGIPTTIANMLGVDRDKMFAPGAAGKTAEYQSRLASALTRFMGDKEEEDRSALERSTFARLKSAGIEGFNDEQLTDLSKDLAQLSESERQKAIADLRSAPDYLREVKLAQIKRVRISHTTRDQDPLATLKVMDKHATALRGKMLSALNNYTKKKADYDDTSEEYRTPELAKSLEALRKTHEAFKFEYDAATKDRQELWDRHREALGLSPAPVYDPGGTGGGKSVRDRLLEGWLAQEGLTPKQVKGQFERIRAASPGALTEEDERWIELQLFGPAEEPRPEPEFTIDQQIEAQKDRIKNAPGSSPEARKTRRDAERRAKELERQKEKSESIRKVSSEVLTDFTEAVDAAESVIREHQAGTAEPNDVKDALSKLEDATESFNNISAPAWFELRGRRSRDDRRHVRQLLSDLSRIHSSVVGRTYVPRGGFPHTPHAGTRSEPGRAQ